MRHIDVTSHLHGIKTTAEFTADTADTIDVLRDEPERQRDLCGELSGLLSDLFRPDAAALAAPILDYLSSDLPRYVAAVEVVVLPALRRRCADETEFAKTQRGLMARLRELETRAAEVASALRIVADPASDRVPAALIGSGLSLIEAITRNTRWIEASIFKPAARRLNREDRRDVAGAMNALHAVAETAHLESATA